MKLIEYVKRIATGGEGLVLLVGASYISGIMYGYAWSTRIWMDHGVYPIVGQVLLIVLAAIVLGVTAMHLRASRS